MPRETYIVTLDRPDGMSVEEMQHFIHWKMRGVHVAYSAAGNDIACTVHRDTSTKAGD